MPGPISDETSLNRTITQVFVYQTRVLVGLAGIVPPQSPGSTCPLIWRMSGQPSLSKSMKPQPHATYWLLIPIPTRT